MYPVYNQFMDSYPSHHMNQNHHHPFPYQSWPHPGYGYYPGYFATPMPPYAPAPPMFYGGYPASPVSYHMMERPCYSPRNMPESYGHCCGCPNHQQGHGRKDENSVKIDEEGSDSVKMAGGYPAVWIPPGLVKNVSEEKEREKKKNPPGAEKDRERSGPSEEEKSFLNRLIPLIMEASGSRNPDSSGFDSDSKQENQDSERKEIPFPFLWMPYNLNDKSTEKKKKDAAEECRKVTVPEKNSVPKVVPVKSVEESTDERPKSSSMKNVDGGKEDGKSSSSRLPPVCLRVDPVNKKRNGKGSSRSPSPPGDKNKLLEVPRESSSKDAEQRETKVKAIDVSKDAEQRETKVKAIDVSGEMTKKDEDTDQNLPKSQVQAHESKEVVQSADGSNSSFTDNMGMRRNLSEGEAATMIQSAYRGYEVRRWEPLKKLKRISEVHNEVVKLGNGISSDTVNDDKRRIVMDETIMSLLLKLDTIQGLHPSIRDVRKSVARELVSLQEKIDQLSQKKPDIAPDRESDEKVVDDQGGQEKEELSGESTHRVHQEVSEGMTHAHVDNHMEILGMDKNDEKTSAASQQPVTEPSEDGKDSSEMESRLEAEERNAVQGLFLEVGDIKPGNCEPQEDKGEMSMTEELLDGELPEGKIEGKNDAFKGKDLTEEPQEVLVDGESPTKDVTEEPQKALVLESWKDEGVSEDVAKEKDLAEQPLGVLDDGDENVLKASSKAEVLDNILENCTNVTFQSHEIPAEASEYVELHVKDTKEGHLSSPSPTSSLGNGDSVSAEEFNKKLLQENEKLREMMQKLIETGNQQLSTISNLSGRLEDLEKKLGRKNRLKVRGKNHRASRKACRTSMNEMVLD